MIDILQIDADLLLWINGHHAPWADTLMWTISRATTWIPLYALLVYLLWHRFGWRRTIVYFLAFVIAIGLSDYISSGLIKPLVCRLRPTHEPLLQPFIHLVNGYTGGLYGFVSSHAANTAACALLFSLFYRDRLMTAVMTLYVLLNCYSRMYLGVHYPGDILCGLIVGCAISGLIYVLVVRNMDRAKALLRRG
jgi:undecaprenyl-diphosphatase